MEHNHRVNLGKKNLLDPKFRCRTDWYNNWCSLFFIFSWKKIQAIFWLSPKYILVDCLEVNHYVGTHSHQINKSVWFLAFWFVDFSSSFVFLLASHLWRNCEHQNSSVLPFLEWNVWLFRSCFLKSGIHFQTNAVSILWEGSKHGFAETRFTLIYSVKKNISLKS